MLWFHLDPNIRNKIILLFGISFILVFSPWTIRNLIVHDELIPFTTQGGEVLFLGTYLRGDGMTMDEVRKIPEFREIEAGAIEKPEMERYHYWKALALEQILDNPLGQIRQVFRKAIKFWVYLPQHTWIPTLKTFTVALFVFPFGCYGLWHWRYHLLAQLSALWFSGLWLFHSIVHSELRYNFPVMPMIFIFGVIGFFTLLNNLGKVNHKVIGLHEIEENPDSRSTDGTSTRFPVT